VIAVVGHATLVESELCVCGGFAAVAFEDKWQVVADPSGATCVISIKPTTARYRLEDKAGALVLAPMSFAFYRCLGICGDGVMVRLEETARWPDTNLRTQFPRAGRRASRVRSSLASKSGASPCEGRLMSLLKFSRSSAAHRSATRRLGGAKPESVTRFE
jgi:hypothetical protein